MAIFNRTYSPLRTQLSMLVTEGSLTQDYDADTRIYTPDRRIRPTAIQPMCGIIDPSGILEDGIVNRYITDVKWYENEISEANLISATNSKYIIDSTSNTGNRGRIIVVKNVPFDAPVTLIFTATFVDMVNGKLRRKAYFIGRSVLASNVAASSPLVLKTDYPRGRCFNPIKELDHLKLSADLISGDTSIPTAYWWYKKNGLNESLITDYVGHNLRELRVPTSSIGKEQHYVCKAQDCRQNLTEVRNEYLQAELDKMADYPRNLLAKQYFLDLNDEIKPGVVTEGKDADGKYICIPNPSTLHIYVTDNGKRDLFSGKMSFKENTVYAIRVVGKYVSEIENQWGFAFVIVYTDGTVSSAFRLGVKVNEKIELVHKSASGKTISHISCTYGFIVPSYIYDIQVTEEYNYNLLEGNTEEVTIEATTETSKSRAIGLVGLSANMKVSLKIDEIIHSSGDSTVFTVYIRQYDPANPSTSVNLSGFIDIPIDNNAYYTFTINDSYNNSYKTELRFYAGKSGQTQGNKITFKNIQLIQGETVLPSMPAYTPHFIPSAPDIEVESEAIQLPEGYRPEVQGKTINHEFTLVTRFPPYRTSVVTPYGDDSGVISIPSDVKLFPARIQVDVSGIGTLDHPERYFSADWGNGLKGMNVLLDADDIGLGIQEVEPDVVEGLDKVKYATSGVLLPFANLEDFVAGSRIVVEIPPHAPKSTGYLKVRKNGIGLMIAYMGNGNVSIFLYGDGIGKTTTLHGRQNAIQRYELRIGASLDEYQLFLNGKLYTGAFNDSNTGEDSSVVFDRDSLVSLMEYYSPDNVLLHKWDFEGNTNTEIFSDKADTENKINFIKGGEYKLIPV